MAAEDIIVLDFAKIEFFENYVISQVKENTTIDQEHFSLFKKLFTAHFIDRPYVYIADRSKSYSVNPLAYMHFDFSDILKGIGIVTTGKIATSNAQFEKKFIEMPFRIFKTMDEAIQWAHMLCK
ncbi:MAG: hypothetical protein WA951_14970 [Leeuwenhoekiella sp.]